LSSFYQILGISEDASQLEVKLAYRKLAKRYHPDVNAGAKGAEEQFKGIVEAYSTLSDFTTRKHYDAKLMGKQSTTTKPTFYSSEQGSPRRKEFSEEDLDRARLRYKAKLFSNMARRKKIWAGMVVTFFIFMGASAGFENWIRNERERDALNLTLKIDSVNKQNENVAAARIENMESPYDDIFGEGQLENNSLNHFVIINEMTDMVICAVQNKTPFKTIRNEYLKANAGFFMRQLPDGFYHIKFYTGKKWNKNQSVPDGRKLGGFTEDELFYEISGPPFYLLEHSNQKSVSNSCDTIIIGPANKNLKVISKETFFYPGISSF